ncbi:MAG TPA: hypothetical protein VM030_11815 [Acidimicrobiales bacterium]|nr:hypothetical protein [Acidimicrobiales bacterium]
MRLRGGNAPVTAIAALSAIVLAAAVGVGLEVGGTRFLPSFPDRARLDYSAGPPGGFAPLDARLVADLLGSRLFGVERPAAPAGSGSGGDAARERSARGGLDAPPVVVTHPFTNDGFDDAYVIPSVPFRGETDTRSATTEPREPAPCGALGGKTAWYRYTATDDMGLMADTFGSTFATSLTIYTGRSLAGLERVGTCSSNTRGNALVAFAATAGTTYFLQVGGTIGGHLVLSLQRQGITTLASVGSNGERGDGDSYGATLAADGRTLLMASGSSTFDGDGRSAPCAPSPGTMVPCGKLGLYLRDRVAHRIANQYPEQSVSAAGTPVGSLAIPGSLTPGGRYVAYWATVEVHPPGTDTRRPSSPYRLEVFRRDRVAGVVERVSVPCSGCGSDVEGSSGRAEMSADGRFIAFTSWAENIVRDDTNTVRDVFVRDMRTRITTRVSVASDAETVRLGQPNDAASPSGDEGSDLLSISSDGRYVVFKSASSNLVTGDTNGVTDVFVRDRLRGVTTRVNLSSDGAQANGETRSIAGFGVHTISDDGRWVFFNSDATNLVSPPTADGVEHVYRRDMRRGTTALVTVASAGDRANAGVTGLPVSDPRRILLTTLAPPLFAGGLTVAVSPLSYSASADGQHVVFNSDADNLVPGDNNESTDIFMHSVATATTTRVSVSSTGAEADSGGACGSPTISGDARFVAFDCQAGNLVDGDDNDNVDVFVRELPGPRRTTGWH